MQTKNRLTPQEADNLSAFLLACDAWEDEMKRLAPVLEHAPTASLAVYHSFLRAESTEIFKEFAYENAVRHSGNCAVCDAFFQSEQDDLCPYYGVLSDFAYGEKYYMEYLPLYEREWAERMLGRANRLANRIRVLDKKVQHLAAKGVERGSLRLPRNFL